MRFLAWFGTGSVHIDHTFGLDAIGESEEGVEALSEPGNRIDTEGLSCKVRVVLLSSDFISEFFSRSLTTEIGHG